ncbi:unnamed protein product, partial [Urochloa humidicola]
WNGFHPKTRQTAWVSLHTTSNRERTCALVLSLACCSAALRKRRRRRPLSLAVPRRVRRDPGFESGDGCGGGDGCSSAESHGSASSRAPGCIHRSSEASELFEDS